MSLRGIGRKLGIDKKTAKSWLNFYGIPYLKEVSFEAQQEARLNHPSLNPSEDLAYILGVLKGDGCVYYKPSKHHYDIELTVTDLPFAKSFKGVLERIGLNPCLFVREMPEKNLQDKFRVCAYSKLFVEWYIDLSIEELEDIIFRKRAWMTSFLRGFYEAEGYASLKRLDITNTDENLVNLTVKLLERLGFHPYIYPYDHTNPNYKRRYQIKLNRKNEVLRFLQLIDPCIKNPLSPEEY